MISFLQKKANIIRSEFTIYDFIPVGDPTLWFTGTELGDLLTDALIGVSLSGLALRTRSKRVKELICSALGYPVPSVFRKTQPRFVGQKFDTYTQKANNLQIWNEEIDPERRYVLILVDETDNILSVHVLSGIELAVFDTTGTLTQKYQARLTTTGTQTELISSSDTTALDGLLATPSIAINLSNDSPVGQPQKHKLLPIDTLFERLSILVGSTIDHLSFTQERNRGAGLHKLVCQVLGYASYQDNGQFPDIKHQLLEVKLQTSPTIDLGLVCPDSDSLLDIEMIDGRQIRHCDIRYAIFYGEVMDGHVVITNLYLTTGKDFFSRFPKFGGNTINRKIQLRLPQRFFAAVNQQSQTNLPAQDDV